MQAHTHTYKLRRIEGIRKFLNCLTVWHSVVRQR